MAAALLPAIIGTAGAIGSGVANLLGQADANATNKQLTRETNAQNKELFERSLAWQEDMWNKSNAYNEKYNDPSAVVQRLERAGINPAFFYGSQYEASASPMSSPSAPQMQAPHVEPLGYGELASTITNSINSLYEASVKQAQTKNLNTSSDKMEAETNRINKVMPYYIEKLQNEAKGEGWKADIARTELNYLQAVQGQRISREFGNNRLLERQIKQADEQYIGYQLQNRLAEVQLSYAPKLNEAQLNNYYTAVNEMKANIQLTMARADLTAQEKLNVIEQRAGIIIDNEMKGVDFDVKQECKNITVGLAREELYRQQDERFERPYNFYREHLGEGKRLGTPGISGAVELYQSRDAKRNRFNNIYDSRESWKYSGRTGRR